jgi:cobyrinic acid a,c-diamide synthase
MKKQQSHFLISATASGSGKTTVTLGLLRALKNRGLQVQPFKCGPDYIDTKHHETASGKTSINLDTYMGSEEHVTKLYEKYSNDADVCITEGVMGLYDGYDGMKGSSADIARLTDAPVILVINAKSMAYSVAPMIYGFKNFKSDINVVGVIFNFVGSESHYAYLKQACDDVGVTALGYLPKQSDIEIPSRHLGLSIDEEFGFDTFVDQVADLVEKHIDIDKLLELSRKEFDFIDQEPQKTSSELPFSIAVAYDKAFNFIYKENIERFREKGTVSFFSPINDKVLPPADFVYLPGGYPEFYLNELSENEEMLKSIKDYVEGGGYLFAECGGMMYLSSAIIDEEGKPYPMADVFKQDATLENMKLTLGYREVVFRDKRLRGHEFHYSKLVEEDQDCVTDIKFTNAKGVPVTTKLFRYRNTIAGYTHMYWAEHGLIELFDLLLEERKIEEDY